MKALALWTLGNVYNSMDAISGYDSGSRTHVSTINRPGKLLGIRQMVVFNDDRLVFHTIFPETPDPRIMGDLCRDINDANCHVTVGGYCVDCDDRMIRFSSSIPLSVLGPSRKAIQLHVCLGV